MDFTQPAWRRDGIAFQPGSLPRNSSCDLLIIGAGMLGLSTALAAAERGLGVQVVDAATVGSGASGLNGGQVIPGLKFDPEALVHRFGAPAGRRLIDFVAGTADAVFDLIRDRGFDIPHSREGWIQASHTEAALATARERHRQWRAEGADVAMLDAGGIAALTGARGYVGGFLDRRGGTIDPLAFTVSLARAATAAGASVAENDRVMSLRSDADTWIAATASGASIRARNVVVAANAYADGLVPGLARSLVALHSFQIATAPLSPELNQAALPGGQAVSDSRRILVYYRRSPDGRLVVGGRGRMSEPRAAADWAHLERAMHRLYPALAGVPITHRWFGRVAMTPDHFPQIHEPRPGLLAVVGCQGRGVALMTALGPRLADYVATGDREALPLPLTPVTPIPFHRFRRLGVGALVTWYRLRDALET